ncbi:hypothetical protein Enr13x_10220 [Stieleria neptunia]|uniref:Uncharacterized protein n=1 Tax=Stieleria neptunia TaxID=2527979 RepID=A0A518HK01_9BACT|nr:hypothetical protein [Stieleria neptunia]QDV41184.1 hypothetical protein Enr13x_10220 [Stieleria neptunia]
MTLSKQAAAEIGQAAAADTTPQPRLMNGRCMVIAKEVFAATPGDDLDSKGFIALRWRVPAGDIRSHVAVFVAEGGARFVVDAAWQQYPFVAKMEKYSASTARKHRNLPNSGRDRADAKASNPATRVFVGTPEDWQDMVEGFNTIGGNGIARRMFTDDEAASRWMSFRD